MPLSKDSVNHPSDVSATSDSKAALALLHQIIDRPGTVLIAYSGGVDSGLLCDIAWERIGKRMYGLLLTGSFIPQQEIEKAILFARMQGFPLIIRPYNMLAFSDVTKNTKERCKFCKQHMASLLWEVAKVHDCKTIYDGICVSDTSEYRPGIAVSTKAGIEHPFLKAGLTKSEIRSIAQARGLPIWNKPSSACLASRIPYGTPLTKDLLKRVESAESYLSVRGFSPLRVRAHNNIARVEISPEQFEALIEIRTEVNHAFRELGFTYTTLDVAGYRSGSMDES